MEQKKQMTFDFHQVPLYPEYNYDDADEMDRDVEYMKQLYPKAVRVIQREIDEECDKLEYDGSCMFDEYPNSEHLGTIVDAIYDRIVNSDAKALSIKTEQLIPASQLPPWGPPPFRPPVRPGRPPQPPHSRPPRPQPPSRPDYGSDGSPDWMKNLISILLYNEMLQRRRRYRRRKRPYRTL